MTLRVHEIELWQRDNPHIHSGYVKSEGTMAAVWRSCGYLHNETGNIWTHAAPALLILALVAGVQLAPPFLIFALSCIACLGMSAIFHLVKSHSQHVHKTGNKLDYLGICVLIAGSMVSLLDISMPNFEGFVFKSLLITLGVGCAFVSLLDTFRTPEWRPYRAAMFVVYGLSGALPIVWAAFSLGLEEASRRCGLGWMLASAGLYIGGAALYGMLVPERFFPGRFDHWGHSHQLFHVCVVAAAWCHYRALCAATDARYS